MSADEGLPPTPQWWWKYVFPAWSLLLGVILVASSLSQQGMTRLGWVSILMGAGFFVATNWGTKTGAK